MPFGHQHTDLVLLETLLQPQDDPGEHDSHLHQIVVRIHSIAYSLSKTYGRFNVSNSTKPNTEIVRFGQGKKKQGRVWTVIRVLTSRRSSNNKGRYAMVVDAEQEKSRVR